MSTPEDRELLIAAAKAHGFVRDGEDDDTSLGLHLGTDGVFYIAHVMGWSPWNPITDDGDALRLANRLCLSINPCDDDVDVVIFETGHCATEAWSEHNGDKDSATRRAIVRAAAALGDTPGAS